jgi:hypothetical protein
MPEEGHRPTHHPLEVLPPLDEEGQLVLVPEEILEVREKKLQQEKHQRILNQMEGFAH